MKHSEAHARWRTGWIGMIAVTLLIGLAVLALTFSATQAQPPTPAVEPVVASIDPYIEYAPNTLLLKLKPGVTLASGQVNAAGASVASSAESLNSLLSALGATSAEPIFARNGVNAMQTKRSGATGLESIYRVQWTSTIPVKHAVAALAADAAVEYAEPDYIARAALTPNDPEYTNQWALTKINAPAAWDVTQGAGAAVIALIDSGIDDTHPDLTGRLWVNPEGDDANNGFLGDVNGWNFVSSSPDISDPNGHGTEVSGVAGAAGNNGVGIAGVCWQCKLMPVVAMQPGGLVNYSDVAKAVQYAASNGAHVINLSLGGYADSTTLRDAIREAATTAVIVAGAGNDDSSTPFYPAAYPEVIAVAATDANDQKAIFSNYGAWIDVSAPGKDIRTTFAGGAYVTNGGTSLSAPFVAGLAGLLKSHYPAWTAEQIKWQILNTAVNIDGVNPSLAGQVGHGRIDAGAALATTPQARANVESYAVDGLTGARPAPGQAFQLVLNVRNLWLPAQSLQGTLSSADSYVTITDSSGAFGDIGPGLLGSNSGDAFGVTLAGSTPYNRVLQFNLTLSGAGGYSLVVPFSVQVRSGVEVLSGTTRYSQDTLWTSDKTYVIDGAVIVNPGITLTIQPGTVIKGNPTRFIRVEGTLIARGTADLPIVFTTNSLTNTTWQGLSFTDSAVNASYDANGNYAAGSVLQHVEVSYATIGLNLSSRAPYIADSAFANNGTSIQIGNSSINNGGSPRIERNTFTGGMNIDPMMGYGNAVMLYGGEPLLRNNSFLGVMNAIWSNNNSYGSPQIQDNVFRSNSGTAIQISGAPSIIGNVIQNNGGSAIQMDCCGSNAPVIRNNVIVGNGGGINASGLQLVDIEHNLIANNRSQGLALDVQSSGAGQSIPALAYNPAQDEYLAAWSETSVYGDIRALRLRGDGQPIGDKINVAANVMPTNVRVAYQPTANRFLVIWSGMGGVQFRFVGANGELSGEIVSLVTGYHVETVSVDYLTARDEFVVAYQKQNSSGWWQSIYVQRLTADGERIGGAIEIGGDLGGNNVYLGGIVVDPSTNKALVTFHSDSWQNRIWGAWIEPATQTAVSTVLSEYVDPYNAFPSKRPAAAFGAGVNRYVAVWEQIRGWDEWNNPRSLMAMPVNADGTLPISATVVFSDTGQVQNPRIVYGATPVEFLAAWVYNPTPGTMPNHKLYGQRLNSDGGGIGDPLLIAAPSPNTMMELYMGAPAIAYNSQRNEYLLAWADNRLGSTNIWSQRLNAAGQLLDNDWTPADETNPANNYRLTEPRGVRHNTIIHNTGNGIQLSGAAVSSVVVNQNNLFSNGSADLYLNSGQAGTQNFTLDATDNFWNVAANQIENRIRDCNDDIEGCGYNTSTIGEVAYSPALAEPNQAAPAFARSVTVNDGTVGRERGTVTIDFSAPMTTSTLPMVSFHDARRGTSQIMITETVPAMTSDLLGRMWFGLSTMDNGGGVRRYDGRNWESYTAANSGLGSNTITAIYAAANGDMWFGHSWEGESALSRLQGTTWITYTRNVIEGYGLGYILSIGQDNQGALWFGSGHDSVYRYDGSAWRRFTTEDGLAGNVVSTIVRDGQGRMWFRTDNGLSVYDGVTWTTHNRATGLPTNQFNSLFADSQGRVWVGLGWYESNDRKYLAMYDGAGWRYFGPPETNYMLSCDVVQMAEAPNGVLWFSTGCGYYATYDGATWSQTYGYNYGNAFLFDVRGNFWYHSEGKLNVRWGGMDYLFTDGRWLSDMRFAAGYDFTPLVLPGQYTVLADGAVDVDGMAAYAGTSYAFQVDFGAGVSLDPPNPPQVTAQTDGALNHLAASWQNSSPNVDQYRYAIGTTPGARNVVGWTYLAGTSFTRSDLNLVQGQSYYVTVQARNTSELWSVDGVSNVVIGGQVVAPPTATPAPGGSTNIYLPSVQR